MKDNLALLPTEAQNPDTTGIDRMETLAMLRAVNSEDQKVALAVETQLPAIAKLVDATASRLKNGGRLVYAGAGTSGRLGVLDASECPPTYNVPSTMVQGIIAGGETALTTAVEGAEDSEASGANDVKALEFCAQDILVGIAASGRTPYVLGAMAAAKNAGGLLGALCCVEASPMATLAHIAIQPVVGPEVITGSTRMKAGTAQKMVLNMISTGVMVRLGKVYGNLMVDVQATNEKLEDRAVRIVSAATGCDLKTAGEALSLCGGEVKTAIVCLKTDGSVEEARVLISTHDGILRKALGEKEG